MKKLTNLEYIEKAKSVHNHYYDYSQTDYVGNRTKISIICPIHGKFEQSPKSHLNGSGCKLCYYDRATYNRNDVTDFIERSKKIHNNKYGYDKIIYTTNKNLVTITCPTHGDFEQIPNSHLLGFGCSKCGQTYDKTEQEIKDFITDLGFSYLENTRKIIQPYELDIVVPTKNIAIEFNGLYWHSDEHKPNNYHLIKTNKCEHKGYQLIHIFEDEWLDKREIVKSRLSYLLGVVGEKIHARKCIIKNVDSSTTSKFLIDNHIQGYVRSKINLGLYCGEELVSIMTFGSLRKNLGSVSIDGNFELLRFCNKLNTTVVGGANKLLQHFIKTFKPIEIISYADRRWSTGNVYEKLGFEFVHNSKPNYFYLIDRKRENRFKYRKDVLVKEGFDKSKTEKQIMKDRGINRIYDCGTKKYVLKF